MKTNYSELSRRYGLSRQTISKYDKGFKKAKRRERGSVLDKYRKEIKEKLSLPGSTITGVYKFIFRKDPNIGSRSNFDYYVRKHDLIGYKKSIRYTRFETEFGRQLQCDFKEDIKMVSKNGEEFKFNVFSAVLSASRMYKFTYSKTKTEEDVIRCLINTFIYFGGVAQEILINNMSAIINPKTKKISSTFLQFAKDFNFKVRRCEAKSPQTKGKVEASNRFLNRLIPYNHEFSDEAELIEIIDRLSDEANSEINQTTNVSPFLLFGKESKELSGLPSDEIIEFYLNYKKAVKVHKDSLIYYNGKRYSVPAKFIGKVLKIREENDCFYIYKDNEIIRMYKLSDSAINYRKSDYKSLMLRKLKGKSTEEIEEISLKNLELLSMLKGENYE